MRALRAYGVVVETATGGSSHYKAKRAGARTYPLAAHNGEKTELDDKYLKKLCANFGIDYEDFKTKL
jgi:hypothetical protein